MTWRLVECTIEGRPALILVDERYRDQAPVDALPILHVVTVTAKLASALAPWHPDETDAFDEVERDLLAAFDGVANGWAVYVARVAVAGVRRYILYSSASVDLRGVSQQAPGGYEVATASEPDPGWSTYRRELARLDRSRS